VSCFPFYELNKCNSEPSHDPKHISFFTLSLLFVNAKHVALIWIVGLFLDRLNLCVIYAKQSRIDEDAFLECSKAPGA